MLEYGQWLAKGGVSIQFEGGREGGGGGREQLDYKASSSKSTLM